MRWARVLATCCAWAAVLASAGSATAAFPGANGKIGVSYDAPPPGGITSIAAIEPDGQGFAELTTPGTGNNDYDPSYSADGERIAFIRVPQPANSGQVWAMNADGSGQTQLTAGTATARDFGPEFSPDGKWIVFDRYNGTVTTQVWIMRSDGSEQTPLTFGSDSSRSPSFSPDGTKIVFSHDSSAHMGEEIWAMNADGSDQHPLTTASSTQDDSDPSFSPDGQRIVFERFNGSDSNVFVMNADGSGQTPVANASQFEISPTFSPDGTKIAFVRSSSGDDLYTVDPDGNNLTPVPGSVGVYEESPITWQPLNPPNCDLTGEAKQKSVKQVNVTLTCSNENAAAIAEGTGKAPKAPKAGLTVALKAKTFTIPPVTAEVPEGTPTNVTLTIPQKARKALKKAAKAGKKGKATISATFTDDLGQSSDASFNVRFKAKKKK